MAETAQRLGSREPGREATRRLAKKPRRLDISACRAMISPLGDEPDMRWILLSVVLLVSACSAGLAPSTTPVTEQSFTVFGPGNAVVCEGTYQRAPDALTASAPVACQDGRSGSITIDTQANGHPVTGMITLVDGAASPVSFMPILGDKHAYARAPILSRAQIDVTRPPLITSRPAARAARAQSSGCCKVCTTGKPCGNSCISRSYTCRKGGGCAC
ncbi:hypothetical protein GN330_12060 [Nitratireductor sp. CAU 1489]|uniref:Uncharacterized protein n=1 Tax=Nitratireductor arenosus TaxID=2682096 RepID=A0A844QJW4_9HYPH|nr:hypothetical protein [Nitratireductor arenosus]MVA97979.1 hypothetical protein [Nitratireductor arenosus]